MESLAKIVIYKKNCRASISGFYNLPSLLNNRSTSLGYGKKMDISKKTVITPPPGTYNAQS